jgi:LacI family transcriptional regulator
MRSEQPPTAFYCANDLMAWGCLQALAKLGKSVPEDVSVVGHNDVEVAANTVPPLTSCRPPSYEMGTQAVEFLLEETMHAHDVNERLVSNIDCQLIGRSSVSFRKSADWDAGIVTVAHVSPGEPSGAAAGRPEPAEHGS